MFFRGRRAMIAVSLLLVALTAAAYVGRGQVGGYHGIWSYQQNVRISLGLLTVEAMKDYPITGIGFGTDIFGDRLDHRRYNEKLQQRFRLSPLHLEEHTKEPHGMFTSIAVRTGWPGLVLFCLFIRSFFRGCIHLIRSSADEEMTSWAQCLMASMVAMLVVGLFEQCLTPVTDMVFYTVVGMVGILLHRDHHESDSTFVRATSGSTD